MNPTILNQTKTSEITAPFRWGGAGFIWEKLPMTDEKTLSWWTRADNANLHWATGGRGRYIVSACSSGNYWNVDHRRGPGGRMRRQLGGAATIEEAKALAQADYELAREAERRR